MHGDAVEAAVLPDQRTARHLDDLPAGKRVGKDCGGRGVRGITVRRHQDRAIQDEEVGVTRCQPSIFFDDGSGPGQGEQPVGAAIRRAQRRQFPGHGLEFGVVRIGGIVAGLEDDGVRRGEAGQGVDVGIGVVALQVAVVEPEHAVLVQPAGELPRQLLAGRVRMALAQALPGGQQGARTVRFDRAAFQCEINRLPFVVREDPSIAQGLHQAVVARRLELPAPAGETEIQQPGPLGVAVRRHQRHRARVAQPGVVVRHAHEPHPVHGHPRR